MYEDEECEENTYYVRTILMFSELTREVLLKLFIFLINGEDIKDFLSSQEQQNILRELRNNNVIYETEYYLVSRINIELEKFDISLLLKLILNLCEKKIKKRKFGWTRWTPKEKYILHADLHELRKIRNDIIGHLPVAKLSKGDYEKKWKRITPILLRVVDLVDNKAFDVFKQRIDEYKGLHVYQDRTLLNKWLQDKVEELIGRKQEFQVYLEAGLERFVRFIKLLFYGGRIVLCGILTRLRDQDLSEVLESKKETLNGNAKEKYFSCPNSQASCPDYEHWDVTSLASALLRKGNDDLSQDDIIYIERIKSIRVNYAALALQSLDPDEFLTIWTDLLMCLTDLYKNIPEEDQQQVRNLIKLYATKAKEGCTVEEYINQLRDFGIEYNFNNETIEELKNMLKQLSKANIKFKQEHVCKLTFLITCKDEETKQIAIDFLRKCLQNYIQKSDQLEDPLMKEMVKLLAILSAMPDVAPVQENRKRKNQSQVILPAKRSYDTKSKC